MKVLFITLSNIGDAILSLPALDLLRQRFPGADVTVVVSSRAKDVFAGYPGVKKTVVYDKQAKFYDQVKLFFTFAREKFDVVADLRNSFFGACLPARFRISPFLRIPKGARHMSKRHLFRVESLAAFKSGGAKSASGPERAAFNDIGPNDENYINGILKGNNINDGDELVVVSAGAKSHTKRWPKERFAETCAELLKAGKKVALVGDDSDIPTAEYIAGRLEGRALNLCARTSLQQLAALLKKARLVVTNDSAVLHLASYLNIPVLAVFGPTSELKYGPWPDNSRVAKREVPCRPCEKALCATGTMRCMDSISAREVVKAALDMLGHLSGFPEQAREEFKRILIIRTDRVGDAVLSTPVVKAMRQAYPHAYIAVMAAPAAKDVFEGNPYLDEVIVFDKDLKHGGWLKTARFARSLKEKRFDLALVLHPTNRVHLITFLAGIPKRVGYDRKLGFLLTDKLAHEKQSGQKHELEYNLDLVRYLGVEPQDKSLFIRITPEAQAWAKGVLKDSGISEGDLLLAIHPAASCPSKIWPKDRFAQAADMLAEKYGFKVLIVAGPKDISIAGEVANLMRNPAVNLAGKTSVSQLAAILERCRVFISNDSGPVHIASAVGTPVVSIFGRAQKGLSPGRWGPVGHKDRFLSRDIGCIECLAHNCVKGFECLGAITVEDVLNMVDLIIKL